MNFHHNNTTKIIQFNKKIGKQYFPISHTQILWMDICEVIYEFPDYTYPVVMEDFVDIKLDGIHRYMTENEI